MIITILNESARDKDLYNDLYRYADEYRFTSRWTRSNVERYLKRQKDFRGMSDLDFDKVVAKVNKDFKRKNKVKSDPYSETSYKAESVRNRIGKRLRENDEYIYKSREELARNITSWAFGNPNMSDIDDNLAYLADRFFAK